MSSMSRYASAWEAVAAYLRELLGTGVLFGLPDDDLGVLKALEPDDTRVVLCRDQRNAVFMATGYALQSNKPTVCLVGRGPALTNALTGVLEAGATGAPLILLASGTASNLVGAGAFQELDQVPVIRPLVKWAYRVEHPDRLCWALEKAAFVSANGSTGPVYVELPEHLFEVEIPILKPWEPFTVGQVHSEEPFLRRSLAEIRARKRRAVLVGGGMRHNNQDGAVERFAEALSAALFVTASGRGVVDEDHPLFCGLTGLYFASTMRRLWRNANLVVSLGSSLEETATFGWNDPRDGTHFVQVNLDPDGFRMEYPGTKVVGEGGATVRRWLQQTHYATMPRDESWVQAVANCRASAQGQASELLRRLRSVECIHVAEVLSAVSRVFPADRVLVQENGLQDMWSYFYPYYSCGRHGGSVLPGEQTSLGFSTAAAAGVRLATGNRPVVAFVGDGAFELFHKDLSTVLEQQIPVVYVVLKNGGYGWLQRQIERQGLSSSRFRFASGFSEEPLPLPKHRYLERMTVGRKEDLEEALRRAYSALLAGKVAVVEIAVRLDDVPPGIREASEDASLERVEDDGVLALRASRTVQRSDGPSV